ncbi:hypothetical protein LMTR13_05775 [Bradyrhizobium icense]|uniref:Uncharacterized protein n=1 Tax=Bradyrhizobium icense TaxID=1274631 RepID=A0A1B1UAE9_9BRAD|nr:hypothetical protein LMTR13_05775 [Bradyrhizobium icense]
MLCCHPEGTSDTLEMADESAIDSLLPWALPPRLGHFCVLLPFSARLRGIKTSRHCTSIRVTRITIGRRFSGWFKRHRPLEDDRRDATIRLVCNRSGEI